MNGLDHMPITQMNGTSPCHVAENSNGFSSQEGHRHDPFCPQTGRLGASQGGEMPMAICGIGLRLPGGLSTTEQLWDFLIAGRSARCRVPASRYNVSAYYSASGKPGTVASEYGYFLDSSVDIESLDTSSFNITRSELKQADPQQRLMLEVSRECFEDAGVTNWRGRKIGCYIGNFGEDWADMTNKETQHRGQYRNVGTHDYIISNRVSYEMDLQGPCMTVRTACSSALVALNEACMAISKGNCEAALVGGVNLILSPGMTIALTEQGVLSPTGSCKSFSADADGYGRAEAVTAIYIKPLVDAIRDGNPVRAVIRATSHNFDGKTPGMMHPSIDAQEALIRHAYNMAGISDIRATGMVECHGTGTAKGDPIETQAIARIFGHGEGIYIGSLKPNLGHSEGASGLTSVIKMILALEHRLIPPNINFTHPNPNIPFESAKLKLPLEPTPWPSSKAERAGVSAFGIGGVNAHVILDSAESFGVSTTSSSRKEATKHAQLLLYSATSSRSITLIPPIFAEWVGRRPDKIVDLAYTLALKREHHQHRCFAVTDKQGAVCTTSSPVKPPAAGQAPPNIIMVFTGQGAQWPLMGRELLQSNATFKTSIQDMDKHLKGIKSEYTTDFTIEDELLKGSRKSRVGSAALSQPLCTAVQIALVDTLKSIGIAPAAVVGHSSGEIAAAYAAGALTASDAITIAHLRGAIVSSHSCAGSMAAIGLSRGKAEGYLCPGVVIACDNSPDSVTISGDTKAVETVLSAVQSLRPAPLARILQVDKAYHSHHMAAIGETYLQEIESHGVGQQRQTTVPFFSSVRGDLLRQEAGLGARYWQDNLESPVRFREAVTSILEHDIGKNALFLEIGPHSALAGPLRQIFSSVQSSAQYASAMVRKRDCLESLLIAIGKIWSLHIPVRLEALFGHGKCLPDLPRYPWAREIGSYWHESRISKELRHRKHSHHELLGARVPESSDLEPTWRNVFYLQDVPWVRHHKVLGDVVFPFAGYIALAGQGVKQLSQVQEGFSIRDMVVNAALIVSEEEPTEIVTTFRRHRITTSLDSQWWWDFAVTSHNSSGWTKHCTGEVRAFSSPSLGSVEKASNILPRKLVTGDWYRRLQRSGLELGPSFQIFQSLNSSVDSSHESSAHLVANADFIASDSDYHIHPTVLDGALQPLACAAVEGEARRLHLWLPKRIKMLSVVRCPSSLLALETSARAVIKGNLSLLGEIQGNVGQNLVIEGSGLQMGLADSLPSLDHAAARYTWAPSIDFTHADQLIGSAPDRVCRTEILDAAARDCLLASVSEIDQAQPVLEHHQEYAAWIVSRTTNRHSNVDPAKKQEVTPDDTLQTAPSIGKKENDLALSALDQVRDNLNHLLSGDKTLEKLLSYQSLASLSAFVTRQEDQANYVSCLAQSKPTMRVLYIGNERLPWISASGMTKVLALPNNPVLRCSKLTIATKFHISEKGDKAKFDNVEYMVLDISRDLAEQGHSERRYDLVITSNVIQEGEDSGTRRRLANIKELLAPGGRLLLQEINPASEWANFVFGSQRNWWRGTSLSAPQQTTDWSMTLKSRLSTAGLGDVEAVAIDSMSAVVVASSAALSNGAMAGSKKITLLRRGRGESGEELTSAEASVLRQLHQNEYEVTTCTLDEDVPLNQDILCLLDADRPFFELLTSADFEALKNLVKRLTGRSVRMLWATRSCQMSCQHPDYASVIGFARTMRSEILLDIATCELENWDADADLLVRVFAKFRDRRDAHDGDDVFRPDFEYAIRGREVNVGRYYPFSLSDEMVTTKTTGRAIADIKTPGRISTLAWEQCERETLRECDVEVEVHAAGLNFRDVLVAMNIVELGVRAFGVEAAGVVVRVGSEVKDVRIGDRVVCLKQQAFATHIVVEEPDCFVIPSSLGFDEAGCMIFAFSTAIQSLVNIGRLEKNQSVLIHSACGGVGLAAIQIAKMLGSEIYATVGNDEKVQFLMENFGIPRCNIFSSRDDSFAKDLMRQTKNKGVDVVLNSLSGELLHATWACVAQSGTMVEIGKRDLLGGGKIDLHHFLANRSYSCVDMELLMNRREGPRRIIKSILEFYREGRLTPVRPVKVFNADEIQDAFRYMQQGLHIGRICLSLRDPLGNSRIETSIVPRRRRATFVKMASYLLVGGLGGIGRAVARWMVERGAGELVFLSRSASDPSNAAFINELESAGCTVTIIAGDVTRSTDVISAVEAARHPIKGIIQMSMVLRDGSFENMTFDDWHAATAPKTQGTWNLHNATLGHSLNFFLLFSSLSGTVGNRHQANYASANTFLDAFVQYRTGLGLPASAIDIGAVEDVGYISQTRQLLDRMKTSGFTAVTEQQLLDAVEFAIAGAGRQRSPSGLGFCDPNTFVLGLGSDTALNSPNNRAVWKDDRRMAVYHNNIHTATLTGEASGLDDAIKLFLRRARADPSLLQTSEAGHFLAVEIGKKMFGLLLKQDKEEPNTTLPLVDMGLDSLLAIELREWWRAAFGFDISTLEMLGMGSLDALGQRAAVKLLELYGSGE